MALTLHLPLSELTGTSAVALVGSNGTYARDASNTTTSGPGTAVTKGQLFVPASSDCITLPTVSFSSGAAWSLSIFVRHNQTSGVVTGQAGVSLVHAIRKTADTTYTVSGNSGTLTFTVSSLGTAAYHHLLATHTAANALRLFINGTESSSGSQSFAQSFNPNRIGLINTTFSDSRFAWLKVFNSDESANVAALVAEKDLAVNGNNFDPTDVRGVEGVQIAA